MSLAVTFRDDQHMPLRFSRQEIRSIVVGGLYAREQILAAYYGNTEPVDEQEALARIDNDLDKTALWQAFELFYDYVTNGVFPRSNNSLTHLMMMAISFKSEFTYAHEFFGYSIGVSDSDANRVHQRLIETGRALEILLCGVFARWKIDVEVDEHDDSDEIRMLGCVVQNYDNNNLALSEIAILAAVQERSVRNYTHQTRSDEERLKTFKKGGRTLVTPQDAKAWLARRRNFIPTTFHSNSDN